MKKLVAYFSASGVTKAAAERLAKAAGADLFEIKPAVPYTRADLDWMNKKSRSSVEMNNPDSRPGNRSAAFQYGGLRHRISRFPDLVVCGADHYQHLFGKLRFCGQNDSPLRHLRRQRDGENRGSARPLCPGAHWEPGKMLNRASDRELESWVKGL